MPIRSIRFFTISTFTETVSRRDLMLLRAVKDIDGPGPLSEVKKVGF